MKNTIKFITLLAIVSLLSGCGKKPEDMFKTGLENYHEGRFLFAIGFFEEALKIEPENIKAKFYLGMSYKKSQQLDKALETIKDCYEIDPNDFYISFNIADCYFIQDNYDSAMTWTRKSLGIKPDFIDSHFLLANAMLKKGQTSQAQDELEFILKILNEDNPYVQNESLFLLSTIYRQQGNFDKAISNLKKILISRPENQEYLYNLGLTYNDMGNQKEALNVVAKLKEIGSEKADDLKTVISKN